MKPVLFSALMVKAILEGRKTQTRRIAKHRFGDKKPCVHTTAMDTGIARHCEHGSEFTPCPYGDAGSEVVLLSSWSVPAEYDHLSPLQLPTYVAFWSLFDSTKKPEWFGRARVARFMPLFLRVNMPLAKLISVRAEQICEISEEDAMAEGATAAIVGKDFDFLKYRAGFQTLWDSINIDRAPWESNPWVWVLEFERVK